MFDEVAGDIYYISFDKLDIGLRNISREHWEEVWVQQALHNIKTQLLAANKLRKAITIGKQEKLQQIFFYFLRKGYLPWNSLSVRIRELEELLPVSPLQEQLKLLIQSERKAAARFVNSFSAAYIYKWIEALLQERNESIENYLSSSAKHLSPVEEQQVKIALLESIASGEELKTIDQYEKDVLTKAHTKPKTKQNPGVKKQELGEEDIYIRNAGLVLLHPFLHELFTSLGLIENKTWKDRTSSYTAMIVLETWLAELMNVLNSICRSIRSFAVLIWMMCCQ